MLFNSIGFGIFFIIVYSLYLLSGHRRQNRLLLFSSFVFYGAWDWRFLSLILITILTDYAAALKIHGTDNAFARRSFLLASVCTNLLILGFFKYFNFFAGGLERLLGVFGLTVQMRFLNIILPIGISFYTFKSMSYTIDVYRRAITPTKNLVDYALFVSFFPELLAGPIDRAADLLPQISSPRKVGMAGFYEGCYLIFWGLFQKVFIADNLARVADGAFAAPSPYNGAAALLAAYAFTFQLYCDFAGYSNIARGLGKLLGMELALNFNLPFFAVNVQDFWNRWHISLSTWVKDYIYIPLFLALRRLKGGLQLYLSIFISMAVLGLWHGAAWKFVVFGMYWGLLLVLYAASRPIFHGWIKPKGFLAARAWFWIRVIFMFHITAVSMIIFRADSVSQAVAMAGAILGNFKPVSGLGLTKMVYGLVMCGWLLGIVQYIQFRKRDLLAVLKLPALAKGLVYFLMYYYFVAYGVEGGKDFIYFKF